MVHTHTFRIVLAVVSILVSVYQVFLCQAHVTAKQALAKTDRNLDSSSMSDNTKHSLVQELTGPLWQERLVLLYPSAMSLLMFIVLVLLFRIGSSENMRHNHIWPRRIIPMQGLFYVTNVIFVLHLTIDKFYYLSKVFGSDAACYCTEMTSQILKISGSKYHCTCMVSYEETLWQLPVNDYNVINDQILRDIGSEYNGSVKIYHMNSTGDVNQATQFYVKEVKIFVNLVQVSTLVVVIYVAISVASYMETNRSSGNLLIGALMPVTYIFAEAIDLFSLLDVLLEYSRFFTASLSLARWAFVALSVGAILVYVIFPLIRLYSCDDPDIQYDTTMRDVPAKACLISINVLLLIIRSVFFHKFGGMTSRVMPPVFFLFILRESYMIVNKIIELVVERRAETHEGPPTREGPRTPSQISGNRNGIQQNGAICLDNNNCVQSVPQEKEPMLSGDNDKETQTNYLEHVFLQQGAAYADSQC